MSHAPNFTWSAKYEEGMSNEQRYIVVFFVVFFEASTGFFYKQHFYKQSQDEIGNKLSKS